MGSWNVILLLTCFMTGIELNISTVKDVDLERYMGKWYEIARFENRFERGLVGCTAEYTLLENGKIKVVNSGYKNKLTGKHKIARGRAIIPNLSDPGKLRVSFFPFIYSDYYILELEPECYDWVLIGSSSPNYLWILSRTPRPAPETLGRILTKASARGYNVNDLIFPEQVSVR